LIVCLKDGKLIKLTESGKLFHTFITLQEEKRNTIILQACRLCPSQPHSAAGWGTHGSVYLQTAGSKRCVRAMGGRKLRCTAYC